MTSDRCAGQHHVDAVRTCVAVAFWFLAAGASAVLGLELDAEVSPSTV